MTTSYYLYCIYLNDYCVGFCVVNCNDMFDDVIDLMYKNTGFRNVFEYSGSLPGYSTGSLALYTGLDSKFGGKYVSKDCSSLTTYRIGNTRDTKTSHQHVKMEFIRWNSVDYDPNKPYYHNNPESNMFLLMPTMREVNKTRIYNASDKHNFWFCSDWADDINARQTIRIYGIY